MPATQRGGSVGVAPDRPRRVTTLVEVAELVTRPPADASSDDRRDDVVMIMAVDEPAGIRRSAEAVTAAVVQAGIPPDRAADVELAVHEALANAVGHGHLGELGIPIEVELIRGGSAVSIRVRDEALGASRPAASHSGADATAGSRDRPHSLVGDSGSGRTPLAERGYGMMLIDGCCDEVVWQSIAVAAARDASGSATEVVLTWRR